MPIPACILLILAHPDDESFFAAGLARRHVERGAKVALVTATRGDAGQVGDPPLCDRDALPALREAELREAADILGISEVHLLDYQDTRLAEAPIDQIRCELVALIRRHRPHVVITFDPNGQNGHADHVAISRFTTDAVAAAADLRWASEPTTPHPGATAPVDLANCAVGGDAPGGPASRGGGGLRDRHRPVSDREDRGTSGAPESARSGRSLVPEQA